MVALSPDTAHPDPAPPASAGPAHPDLGGSGRAGRLRTIAEVAAATMRQAWHDRILGLSAEAAFWQLLSVPPLLLGVLGLLGYSGGWIGSAVTHRIEQRLLGLTGQVLQPDMVHRVVAPMLDEVLQHGRGGVATFSFILALWAGSSATSTFVNTTTIAYGQRDLRGALRSRLLALWMYLCALAVGTVAVPLLVLGPGALVRAAPQAWREPVNGLVHALYWPVMAVVMFGALSTFYHLATPLRLRWRRAFPGAALALALFLLLSYLLQLYIAAVADRLLVFSTLAAPILALFYFYVIALAVLLGAELNATLERRWPRGPKPRPLETIRGRVGGRAARRDAGLYSPSSSP